MRKNVVVILLLALVVVGFASMAFGQDSTGTGGGVTPLGNFTFIAGIAGLVLKALIYVLERLPNLPNQVVAAIGGVLTAGIVWGLSAWFSLDYQTVLGAVTTGSWIGSLGSTAAKTNGK